MIWGGFYLYFWKYPNDARNLRGKNQAVHPDKKFENQIPTKYEVFFVNKNTSSINGEAENFPEISGIDTPKNDGLVWNTYFQLQRFFVVLGIY